MNEDRQSPISASNGTIKCEDRNYLVHLASRSLTRAELSAKEE